MVNYLVGSSPGSSHGPIFVTVNTLQFHDVFNFESTPDLSHAQDFEKPVNANVTNQHGISSNRSLLARSYRNEFCICGCA